MRVLDIFAGIGGFSLGLERAGMQTVAFCEIDPYCRAVLENRFRGVPCYEDASNHSGIPVSGSFACRKACGPHWLSELIGLHPPWLVIENTAHRWRAWVPELRRDLAGLGYASLPLRVRASDLGAPHHRARVFLIANPDSERLRELSRWWHGEGWKVASVIAQSWYYAPGAVGTPYGLPDQLDRRRALGNAVVPQIAEIIGRGILACR